LGSLKLGNWAVAQEWEEISLQSAQNALRMIRRPDLSLLAIPSPADLLEVLPRTLKL
jgi:hypothetical protein